MDTLKSVSSVIIKGVLYVENSLIELRRLVACLSHTPGGETFRLSILLLFLLRFVGFVSSQFGTSDILSVAELRSTSPTSTDHHTQTKPKASVAFYHSTV
jgi:hypothetical protein